MKTNFVIYKLHFTTPLHISSNKADYGETQKIIHSDTFYAAVTACLAKIGHIIPEDGDLKCTISSLFPYRGQTLYFPKPLNLSLPSKVAPENLKLIKNVTWLEKSYFEKAINGKSVYPEDNLADYISEGYLAQNIAECKPDINSKVTPRVTVSRQGSDDAVPFHIDRIYFGQDSGFYFLATGDTSLLEKGLSFLQNEGIGTDRNVGNGFFTYEKGSVSIDIPETSILQVSLSVFIPEDQKQLVKMLDNSSIAYDMARRGGWITAYPFNTCRKNFIYSFLPASVFSNSEGKVHTAGAIVNLKPEIIGGEKISNIWRCGRALFIPTL